MRIFTKEAIELVKKDLNDARKAELSELGLATRAYRVISYLRRQVKKLRDIVSDLDTAILTHDKTITRLRHAVVEVGKMHHDDGDYSPLQRDFEERGRIIRGLRDALETAKIRFRSFYCHGLRTESSDPKVGYDEIEKVLNADLTQYAVPPYKWFDEAAPLTTPKEAREIAREHLIQDLDLSRAVPFKGKITETWASISDDAKDGDEIEFVASSARDLEHWRRVAIRGAVKHTKRENELLDIIVDLTNKNEDLGARLVGDEISYTVISGGFPGLTTIEQVKRSYDYRGALLDYANRELSTEVLKHGKTQARLVEEINNSEDLPNIVKRLREKVVNLTNKSKGFSDSNMMLRKNLRAVESDFARVEAINRSHVNELFDVAPKVARLHSALLIAQQHFERLVGGGDCRNSMEPYRPQKWADECNAAINYPSVLTKEVKEI